MRVLVAEGIAEVINIGLLRPLFFQVGRSQSRRSSLILRRTYHPDGHVYVQAGDELGIECLPRDVRWVLRFVIGIAMPD